MRMPRRVFAVVRPLLVLGLILGSVALVGASKRVREFTIHDKAYYADQNLINFVRPGLNVKLVSASIASDGTIQARVTVTDPKGVPLDKDGVITPGPVSLSFIAATIPQGKTQFTAYTTRPQTSPITGNTAIQASSDSGGTWTKNADGDYTYTFKTKAPAGFDQTATHRVGVQANRNLNDFDLGTQYDSDTYDFVPNGSAVTSTRDVVRTAACNKCHDQLAFHGGSRRGVEMCVMCHTPQTTDPDTGNTVDFKVMVHRIHAGSSLPSVKAGGKYQIIGYQQSVSDFSTVSYPADVRNCQTCHDPNSGAAQKDAWLKPSQEACGSCHDNVNFATGANHVNLPQLNNNQCASCHQPQGELEFDASIKGAHTIENRSAQIPGVVIDNVQVSNNQAGQTPTVTYTLKDYSGNPIPLSQMTGGANRLYLVMSGPTTDYGTTNFGSDLNTKGYVSEDGSKGSCDGSGNCTYTFKHAIPADATGTFAIGFEARRGITLNAGMTNAISSEYGAKNVVTYFSVDGSPVQPRRAVVAVKNCNNCHSFLSLHGENRNQIEQCVLCHNNREDDTAYKAKAKVPADKTSPPQSIYFARMIHRIHTGEHALEQDPNSTFVIVGYNGSHNDFNEVRYPAMSRQGETGDRRNCEMCHLPGTEQNLPMGLNQVVNPQGFLNPIGPVAAGCTGCHVTKSASSHALSNTTTQLGEACDVCHGASADFNINKVHAQ